MLVLLFLILLFSGVISSEPCHLDDIYSILAFKNSFSNGDILRSWSSDMDCCYIFECEHNRVIEFTITNSELSGSIKPDAFAGFTYLQRLRLHKMPFLVGEIPRSIENLTHLTYLEINWTNVTGQVPNNLSNLKNLMILDFSFNKLYGSIPPSLPLLPSIFAISLDRNQLTGSLPESYGHFPTGLNLPVLILSHNKLSGKLPISFATTNFSRIDLSRNNLSGDASMLFGEDKGCQLLDISRNKFEFDFSNVGFMNENLVTLDISHNKIYGKIPAKITDAFMLQQLNMSYNRLCGEIPKGWKLKYRQEGFDNSSFSHNRCLCGAPLHLWKQEETGACHPDIKDMLPLLFFILVFPGVISSEPCHPDDIYSILAFKNSFSNGDILQTWSSDMDCCHRFDCENNRVTVFSIFKLELSGSIKPDASK